MSRENIFSLGYSSLQVQLKNLFEEAGGESAIEVMDLLSALPAKEKQMALKSFIKSLEQLVKSHKPQQSTDGGAAFDNFEEELYQNLLEDLGLAEVHERVSRKHPHLRVTSKEDRVEKTIDLDQYRKLRKVNA